MVQASEVSRTELAEALTQRAAQVQLLDNGFEQHVRGQQLYVIDKDLINIKAATDTSRSFHEARKAILYAEMRRQLGFGVVEKSLDDFLEHIDDGGAAAWRVPYGNGREACIMLPGEPDQYVAAKDKALAGRVAVKAIKGTRLTHAQNVRRTDLHEMVHCMDRWFVPNLDDDNPDRIGDEYIRYKAEMLADVGAVLFMAQRNGDTNIAGRTADLRALGVRASQKVNGRHLRFSHGPGDSMRSVVYDTAPGLRYAQRVIDHMGLEKLRGMTPREIVDLAKYSVDRMALDRTSFEIMVAYTEKGELGIAALSAKRGEEPGWSDKVTKARVRLAELANVEKRIVDPRHLRTNTTAIPAPDAERLASWVDWVHERAKVHGGGSAGVHKGMAEALEYVRRNLAKNEPLYEDEIALIRALPEAVHKDLKAKADALKAAQNSRLKEVQVFELAPLIIRGEDKDRVSPSSRM
ncbi:MAG: hypothetical protein Alpg2KO_06420 [Alphaproteobacteria bacterium]